MIASCGCGKSEAQSFSSKALLVQISTLLPPFFATYNFDQERETCSIICPWQHLYLEALRIAP